MTQFLSPFALPPHQTDEQQMPEYLPAVPAATTEETVAVAQQGDTPAPGFPLTGLSEGRWGEEGKEHMEHSPLAHSDTGMPNGELRAYMIQHSIKGSKIPMALKAREPFVGEIVIIHPEYDPEIDFGIKRVGTRERIIHQDRNATVRYSSRGAGDDGSDMVYTTEKDYPAGTMKLDTITLCLVNWNLADKAGNPVPVSRETIQDYLDPEKEFDWVYEECLRINPILLGDAARKKD